MRIVVTGLIAQYPFGGVIWDYVQYLLGFRALGHDVTYLEDTCVWPYDPIQDTVTADCSYHVAALQRIMDSFGLGDRWIYRNAADGKFHGAGETLARDLIKNADLLVNVSAASWLEHYDVGVRHKMFIDGDPMFTQIDMFNPEKKQYTDLLRAHDSHFSFGLNLGQIDCLVPTAGINWMPTLQPVSLEHWTPDTSPPLDRFTTVMNWVSYPPKQWQGKEYGQKDLEFLKFINLPRHTSQPFVLAMGKGAGRKRPTEEILAAGWNILEPDEVIPDHGSYRGFLRTSKGEWSIAKHGYVAARTGWFSCRTACYLAAGRPAVVQDTGWADHLPHGEGLISFHTMEESIKGIAAINADYSKHSRAARAFAEQHLDARIVCQDLLERSGLC